MSQVTRILHAINTGDERAADKLLPLVYDELRRLAAQRLAHEKAGQTLQATALVHDAYLRLVDSDQARDWNGRGHFFAAAAEAMRRILVERARRRAALKHGAAMKRVEIDDLPIADPHDATELLAINDALTELEKHDRLAGQLVKLRYFGGLTQQEAAACLRISSRTADRLWVLGRAWLYRQIRPE